MSWNSCLNNNVPPVSTNTNNQSNQCPNEAKQYFIFILIGLGLILFAVLTRKG
jgi:hypothetical protein